MASFLGVDIGGTKTALVLGGADGTVWRREVFSTEPGRGFDAWLADVTGRLGGLGDSTALDGIGVSVGGPLDPATAALLSPPHLAGWPHGLPVAERLAGAVAGWCGRRVPVHVMHDARAGAWAEWRFGLGVATAVPARRLAFLTFATGFGAGVVLDGQALDIPGEVGHWRVADDGPEMFGKRGGLEGLASGAGLSARAAAAGLPSDNAALADAARAGDAGALALWRDTAVEVGRQCARMIDLFGLDAIALGTLAVKAPDLVMDTIRATAAAEALPHLAARCVIAPAALGARLGDVAALAPAIRAAEGAAGRARELAADALAAADPRLPDSFAAATDRAAAAVVEALAAGGKVLTFGNGGSATDAAHLAQELTGRYRADRRPLPAVCLSGDAPAITCIGNDFGFEAVFARPVEALARPGDVVVAFTTSGRSPNVNAALRAARTAGAACVVFSGKGGGESAALADIAAVAPGDDTPRIQELHTLALHVICDAVEARFATEA